MTAKGTFPSAFFRALGKDFAESQIGLGKIFTWGYDDGDFAECQMKRHSAKIQSSPSASRVALGKD